MPTDPKIKRLIAVTRFFLKSKSKANQEMLGNGKAMM